MGVMKVSPSILTLGIAALLVTACEKKGIVGHARHPDLATRSDTSFSAVAADRRAAVEPEVARRQAAYAVQIGGEKYEVAARKPGQDLDERTSAGRDLGRR